MTNKHINSIINTRRFFYFFCNYCSIKNESGKTLYFSIVNNPNDLHLEKIAGGITGSLITGGINAEADFTKSIQINQILRLLDGESLSIKLDIKNRYITVAYINNDERYHYCCISYEIIKGHNYVFTKNVLNDPIIIKDKFID